MKSKIFFAVQIVIWSTVVCDVVQLKTIPVVEEITTLPPPPRPYAFGYAAGRFPGNIDRTHSEVSDGSGVVHGVYSYVDPKFQIRTVEYTADKDGFHPILNKNPPPLPVDTAAVAAAKERHLQQYAKIASAYQAGPGQVVVPYDTVAVEKAKQKHFTLFEKIAEEHARIAAEREATKSAEESLAEPNLVEH